ncbi:MAG: hypothetical protein D4R76_09335 [Methylococcus sp.]|nr:MAG: hypothetical protein D4R76_09335 [Methylococcus sp.]
MPLFSRKINESGPWLRVGLSAAAVAEGDVEVMESVFRQIYWASNAPEGMAFLISPLAEDGSRAIFFSPASYPYVQSLIRIYDAVPIEPPFLGDLAVRVGAPVKPGADSKAF